MKTNTLKSPAVTSKIIRHIGLDVHKDTIAVAVAEEGGEPQFLKTISHDLHAVEKLVKELRDGGRYDLRMCYEAGPTGYVLARRLKAWGIECLVLSPTHIPKASGDKIKTDRRDAVKLARFLRSGDARGIHIPDEADEAVRDLCRARTDAVEDLRRLRQQLKGFLLRNGYRYSGKSSWTQAHLRYLRELVMCHPAQKFVLEETLESIDRAVHRLGQLELHLESVVATWRMKPAVEALQCLRGIAFIAATVLISELGDLTRFSHPKQLMAYLGLVTNERSTGTTRRQGSITKCGNGHARLFLIDHRSPGGLGGDCRRQPAGRDERERASQSGPSLPPASQNQQGTLPPPGRPKQARAPNRLDRTEPAVSPHLEVDEPQSHHSESRRRHRPRTQRVHLGHLLRNPVARQREHPQPKNLEQPDRRFPQSPVYAASLRLNAGPPLNPTSNKETKEPKDKHYEEQN